MTSGDRRNLDRDVVAAAALGLTDAEGLDGLSMRKLGAELGVEAMSLYHYVESKDDLLDAVLDRLYAEVELPRQLPDDEWEKAVRAGLRAFHRVLVDHPAALVLFSSRPARSPASLDVISWAYRRFQAVGLDVDDAIDAFRFAVSFVIGHTAQEVGVVGRTNEPEEPDYDQLDDADLRAFMVRLRGRDEDELFNAGLDLVIDGLKARFGLP